MSASRGAAAVAGRPPEEGSGADVADGVPRKSLLAKAAFDSLLILPAVVVAGLMGLIGVVVLGKVFSPSEFGKFTIAHNTLVLLSMVGGLWLNSSLLRLIPQYRRTGQLGELTRTALVWGTLSVILLTAVSAIVLAGLTPVFHSDLYWLLWLAVAGTPLLIVFGVIQIGYRANGQSGRFSALTLVRVLGGFVVGFVMAVPLGWGPAGMLAGLIIVVALSVAWYVLRHPDWLRGIAQRPSGSRHILMDMATFSGPIVGVNIAALVLSVSDRFVIEGYLSAHEVGLYSAGYAIAEGGMRLISNVIQLAVNPIAYDSWENHGQTTTFRFIEQLFRIYALIAIPAVVGLSLLSKPVIVLFTTSEFSDGATIIPFVAVALLFHGYALLMNIVFDATKKTSIPFFNFASIGALNLVANVILIPHYGFEAAAWTTTGSYVLLFGLTVLTVRSVYPLRFWGSYLWKSIVASAGMALVVVALRPEAGADKQLLMTVGVGALCYAVLLFTVKGIEISELRGVSRGLSTALLRRRASEA